MGVANKIRIFFKTRYNQKRTVSRWSAAETSGCISVLLLGSSNTNETIRKLTNVSAAARTTVRTACKEYQNKTVNGSVNGGTRWRSWLRHCATSRKVAGSIPDGVIGIFHWHNPSGRSMALVLTHPLTETNTRCVGLTTSPPSCADCLEIWEPQPPGTLRACPGL